MQPHLGDTQSTPLLRLSLGQPLHDRLTIAPLSNTTAHREISLGCGLSGWRTSPTGAAGAQHRRTGAATNGRCTKPSRRLRDQRFSWLRANGADIPQIPPRFRSPVPCWACPTGMDCASRPYRRTRIKGYHVARFMRRVRRSLSASVRAGSSCTTTCGDARGSVCPTAMG